ncbi:MAG: hypothetical protein K5905_10205 [Roseibium sp.]|uniref:hypothetical protein n=1 Tax=Roseibium sp. TaxID=1936156 RepID=UPI00262523D8|nr:hypothetical protein [Roseibium sp.]MCV0425836.1 hypothetical protein [Roseibium sp.]
MKIVVAGILIFLTAFAARSAIIAPQITFGPKTEFRNSEQWTLRISKSKLHKSVIVLSVSGNTAEGTSEIASLVYYCLDKDFLGVSFFVLPGGDRFKLLADQDARYKLRDDMEREMPVVPIDGLAKEYEAYLEHLEPSVRSDNLVMIKYPAHANALLFNSRNGGRLRVSMKDKYDAEFQLQFDVDGLTELHDTVRKKCGW